MRKKSCPLEREVMDCLKREKLSLEIKKHISECPFCQDIVSVHKWMNEFRNESWNAGVLEKVFPHPESIWNRAFAKRRPDKGLVKKALRPLQYFRVFSYAVIITGIIFLFLLNKKGIGSLIETAGAGPVLDTLSKAIPQLFPIFLIPMAIIIVSMLFCFFIVAFEKLKKTA